MSSWIVGLVAFAACLILCLGQDTVKYTCNKNGTHMTMKVTEVKGSHSKYITLDTSDSTFGCESTTTIDISGTDYLTMEIVTDVTTNLPIDNTCDVSASGTVVTYIIVRQTLANMLQPTDLKYIITCDSSSAAGVEQELADQDIQFVDSVLTNKTLSVSNQDITFTLLDTGNAEPATIQFASSYKFQITLTREGVEGVPVYLQITGLMAAGTSTYENAVDMLTSDGCGIAGSTVFIINDPLSLAAAPTYTSTSVVGTTGTFVMGLFTTKKVWFKLYYDLSCYTTTTADNRCLDTATYCASLRKKRSVDKSARNGTLELAVDVVFGNGASSGLGGDKGKQETMSEKECKMVTSFWVVALVLGILLLIVLVFAVMLFFRLRREQKTKLVDDDRTGVRNPSF